MIGSRAFSLAFSLAARGATPRTLLPHRPLRSPFSSHTASTPIRGVRRALSASGGSSPDPFVGAVLVVSEWASSHGALGLCAFAAAHIVGVVICFPATILFEIAAGFLFGMVRGSVLAWAAKVVAAMITFFVSSGIARKALAGSGVEEKALAAFRAQPALQRLAQNIEHEGARYTFLARLSPIPSWLNNYGLAFAGVPFASYAPATAIASLPTVLTHVYAGSLLSSLQTLVASSSSGNAGMNIPSTLAGSSLGGLSAVMGCLLLREVAKAVLTPADEETPDVENLELFNKEKDNAEWPADPQNRRK